MGNGRCFCRSCCARRSRSLALAAVALQPAYPYAFTLPVALTQDWGIAQDLLALAALLAATLPAPRFPAPRGVEVFGLCFVVYAALVPEWAWQWDSHPGNEPKTLRQAVALGHWLTFDAEAVSGPMERLETRPLWASLASGASTVASESGAMLAAVARGEAGKDAIRATRVSRQVVRGKDGGVYSVLAPGPSLLLAPALRVDRAINRARGVEGRVAVSVLLFCALGAWLVAALFLLLRDATERPGLAAALSFFLALVPPFLFYFHQFYPEMLGALVLAIAFRTLAFRPERIRLHAVRFGVLVAVLPWLHQKFLPVWGVLLVTALVVGWRRPQVLTLDRSGWKWAALLLAPNLVSLYLTALYNFAITGSVRPDALFLAWGPGGVTSARLGQGVLGLLFDSRYGILPYVPLLILAAAGLVLGGARKLAPVLPAALAYYLTVASADNWSGAVCNLGRYVMPVVPLFVALVGMRARANVGAARRRRAGARARFVDGADCARAPARPARRQRLVAAAGEEHVRGRAAVRARPLHPDLGGRGAGACRAARHVGAADRRHGLLAEARGRGGRECRRVAAPRARRRGGDTAPRGLRARACGVQHAFSAGLAR